MSTADVCVVGAGLAGLWTAEELSRRGRRPIVFEQFEPGHALGSSHGDSRIFRLSYPDPAHVGLALESRDGWNRLERMAGQPLLELTGGLDLGPEEGWRANFESLRDLGLECEILDAGELSSRHPGLALPDGWTGLSQPDAGVLRAEACLAALREKLDRQGIEVRAASPVTRIEDHESSVTVMTVSETLECGAVVLAAGAWNPSVLAGLGLSAPLAVNLQTVVYARAQTPIPVLICHDREAALYALPAPGGLVRAAHHGGGPSVTDPGSADRTPDPGGVEAVMSDLRALLGEVEFVRAETCLYTNTPDSDFVLDRIGNVVVASACSGHGFKMGPAIGRLAADLVVGIAPLARFSLERFAPQ